jgi:hypothetical protein
MTVARLATFKERSSGERGIEAIVFRLFHGRPGGSKSDDHRAAPFVAERNPWALKASCPSSLSARSTKARARAGTFDAVTTAIG